MDKILTGRRKPISAFMRLFSTLILFGLVTIAFYLYVYFQMRMWQAFIVPIFTSIGILTVIILVGLRRERENLAGWIMVITLGLTYLGGEIAWKGLTVYHTAGGMLIILLAGGLIFPRQWRNWVSAVFFFLIGVLLVNRFEPVSRIDQGSQPMLFAFVVGISLLLILALIFLLLLTLPVRSIRIRLIGTFLLLVVVPVALTGTVAMVINAQISQTAVLRQLESVAYLKEAAIRTWLTNLTTDLETIASGVVDLQQVEVLLRQADQTSDVHQRAYKTLKQRLSQYIQKSGFYSMVLIANPEGVVVFSTDDTWLGKNVRAETFFSAGLRDIVVLPPVTKEGQGNLMFTALPLQSTDGQTVAVLAGKVNLAQLNRIMTERVGLGNTGETYLVNRGHYLITDSLYEGYKAGESHVFSPGIDQALYKNLNGSGSYAGYRVKTVLGVYRWIPELGVALLAEQERSEALRSTYQGIAINLALMAAALAAALVIGYIATNRITTPLATLAKTAEQIAAGNLQLTAETEQLDEIGALSKSFNSMTAQLRSLVANLEQRVADRTRDLERRSKQLQIAAEVAREATAVHDLNELLHRSVNLIHDRFGYYHVAIYLLDEQGENAVLVAATGEAGQIMLARGHRLRIEDMSSAVGRTLVSDVARSGRARISQDTNADPAYYPNLLLPETRSEAALPLKAGAGVKGVLDVHSIEPGTFDEETAYILQIVSDQLAIAIQNAFLIEELQRSVEELQRMYGTYTRVSWKTYQRRFFDMKEIGHGYRYHRLGIEPVQEELPLSKEAIKTGCPVVRESKGKHASQGIDANGQNQAFAVPIKVRGQTIGALEVELTGQSLPEEIVSGYQEIADRLALILENARLLQDAQNLAQREHQINILSSRIRSSVDLDTILQNTVRELGKAFGATRTFVQLGVQVNGAGTNDHPAEGADEKEAAV